MSIVKKIIYIILRKLIFLFDGIDNKLFTNLYYCWLKRRGVIFNGKPNYISSSAYIDGQGYKNIVIGKDVVISREVMILTHDYSVETAFHSINEGTTDRKLHFNKGITIGNNSFIGARVSLLPGSKIGDNCIIGACSVIKGEIPNNSIVIGNPAKIINTTYDYAYKCKEQIGDIIS